MQDSQPHVLLAVTAAAATASAASWALEHAVWFTITAAISAVMSGIAAFMYYIVSIYYKVKYAQKDRS